MDRTAQNIKNRLSLLPPQAESLEILNVLCDILEFEQDTDFEIELNKVNKKFPTYTDFERELPSLCFALATGVSRCRASECAFPRRSWERVDKWKGRIKICVSAVRLREVSP